MSEWTKRDQARRKFFHAALAFARSTESGELEGLDWDSPTGALRETKFREAWVEYRQIIDDEESAALVRFVEPSWLGQLANFVFFWRSRKDSAAQRRATEKAVKRLTPPSGGGGPWG